MRSVVETDNPDVGPAIRACSKAARTGIEVSRWCRMVGTASPRTREASSDDGDCRREHVALDTAAPSVSVFVVAAPWSRSWSAPTHIWRDRRFLREQPEVEFALTGYTCGGSGTKDLGATLSLRRQLALVEWASPDVVDEGAARLVARWRDRGADVWQGSLVPLQAHGSINGETPFAAPAASPAPPPGPVAVLSYGKVRWSKAITWYARALPKAQRSAVQPTSGMIAGLGFTDLPVRHACTFSFWSDPAAIARYSSGKSSGHSGVRRDSVEQRWFTESLFARFTVTDHRGSWSGGDPLSSTR